MTSSIFCRIPHISFSQTTLPLWQIEARAQEELERVKYKQASRKKEKEKPMGKIKRDTATQETQETQTPPSSPPPPRRADPMEVSGSNTEKATGTLSMEVYDNE
jgi:hypothetical protein